MPGTKQINLTAYTDSGLHETVRILGTDRKPKDLTGWEVHASAVVSIMDTEEALPVEASIPDPATGDIQISIDPVAVAALFPEGDPAMQKSIPWTLLAKPYGTYKVKLAGGTLQLERGAGRW